MQSAIISPDQTSNQEQFATLRKLVVIALIISIVAFAFSTYAVTLVNQVARSGQVKGARSDKFVAKINRFRDLLSGKNQQAQRPTTRPTPTPTPVPTPGSSGAGLPVGPFHLPTSSYGTLGYTGAFLDLSKMSVDEAKAALEAAKNANVRLIVTTTGGGNNYEDAAGYYSYPTFQSTYDRLKTLDLASYVSSGTVLGNLIMDEPQDASNWSGKQVTLTEIKQAAKYAKSMWPTVPVGVGSNPSYLAGGGWSSADLDFVSIPFTENKLCSGKKDGCYGMTISDWSKGVVADAKADNLGLVMSINVLDGGTPRGSEITGANLDVYGKTLAAESYACALTFWKWDSAYFVKSDVKTAMADILQVAKSHQTKACKP